MPSIKEYRTFRAGAARTIGTVLLLLSTFACYKPRTMADPIASGLIVRNASLYDINVFALRDGATKEWLITVPAKGFRTIGVEPRLLNGSSSLVVVAQAIGASRQWTSAPVRIDTNLFGILDLMATSAGDCSPSSLSVITASEVQAAMR